MKNIVLSIVALASTPVAASAQTAPAPAPAAQPAARADLDTPIETLMANPATRAVVLKTLPELEKHPAYEQFKIINLRQLAPMSGGSITDEKLATIESGLKAIK